MGLAKLKLPVALALVCMAFFVTFMQVKANEDTDDPVGTSAIWSPENEDLSEIAQSCKAEAATAYNKCFIEQMGSYASSEAVTFSEFLFQQTPARVGYLSGLHEAGPIDLGLVTYPNSAGLNRGWVLVNGAPAIVDVDNLKLLPQSAMEKDAHFSALRTHYPQLHLAIADDDRGTETLPEMQALGNGSQRFVINYSLKEPCPACQAVAHASFGFDFDPTGKFLGVKFIKVVPAI
ncbi:MAG TPA: hypothetical protein VKH81_01145 [Candidatus Angelobacter sp.]|nr:hypothetical protein [Candidatus Angelobacter sp.]